MAWLKCGGKAAYDICEHWVCYACGDAVQRQIDELFASPVALAEIVR